MDGSKDAAVFQPGRSSGDLPTRSYLSRPRPLAFDWSPNTDGTFPNVRDFQVRLPVESRMGSYSDVHSVKSRWRSRIFGPLVDSILEELFIY